MLGPAQHYRELVLDLSLRRTLSDGELSPVQEALDSAELDHCWHAMTDDEQDVMEQWLAATAPSTSSPEPTGA